MMENRKTSQSCLFFSAYQIRMFLVWLLALMPYCESYAGSLLHNSDQFACNFAIYKNETDCNANGGTWSSSKKWAGGWGLTDTQYGLIDCSTCHQRGTSNIKFINPIITAASGSFPGSSVSALQADGENSDYGDDSDSHTSSQRVCEVCHSQTLYHRYDTTNQVAESGSLEHFNNSDCITCHPHNAGFRPNCADCHGNSTTGDIAPDSLANNVNTDYSWADDAGSHARHIDSLGGNASCDSCHPIPGISSTHLNDTIEISETNFTYAAATQTCSDITCHGNTAADWGTTSCLGCHSVSQGSRIAVSNQFSGNSHHVQSISVSDAHCYQCHWEANSDGTIDPLYHGGTASSSAVVDLVIYGAGTRPTIYTLDSTSMTYFANGSRQEIAKLNDHCLGCHSDQNSTTQPFGDGKTPQEYAWDSTSVASRYSQSGTTSYGKYISVPNAAQKIQTKAYSAHGQATLNEGGWSTTTGVDGALPNTRAGTVNVACFDCHNSHGSTISGITTSYTSATSNGGILKDTQLGQGGYAISYQPTSGGTTEEKNQRNPGASLCIDCHLTADGSDTQPWGYQVTFGASERILGYYDPPEFTSTGSGQQTRYAYKNQLDNKGGHFGASSALGTAAMGAINGLCTPCHDPHGVSTSLGGDQEYGIPLLKGTWLTSPYKEDVAPTINNSFSVINNDRHIHLDQNTFGSHFNQLVTGITETASQFAGLCLNCHPQSSLTADGSSTPNAWMSKERIHESVKGWKTSNGTVKHTYSCSKCHTPHSGGLPRLMLTNCMNSRHKGQVVTQNSPKISYSSSIYDCNEGAGRIPGNYWYDATGCPDDINAPPPPHTANVSIACHEGQTGSGTNQSWNSVTPWGEPPPVYYGTIQIAWNDCKTYPENSPGDYDSADWTVRSGSRSGTIVATGSGGGPGWDGIDEITVKVSDTPYFLKIDWSWDGGNDLGTVYHDNVYITSEGELVYLPY